MDLIQQPDKMLWLALYLPQLPLQSATTQEDHPCLVYETCASRQTVYRLNDSAAKAGIETGMPLTAAHSLCDNLIAIERDTQREQAALQGLSLWALQFTSKISLEPPDGLILEIGASLKLFGGLESLRQSILDELTTLGYHACYAIAPIAQAAWLLALNRVPQTITQRQALTHQLTSLPISLLPITAEKKNGAIPPRPDFNR